MLPVLRLSINLYSVLESGARIRVSLFLRRPVGRIRSHPHVFTVVHFIDQFLIGLPHLFAHYRQKMVISVS